MNDDQQKNDANQNYANDELDVYEALLKLEESYGKELLSERQREKLLAARESLRKLKQTPEEKMSLKSLGESPNKAVDVLMYALKRSVEIMLIEGYEYCSIEEWKEKPVELRAKIVEMFFYLIYEVKEKEFEDRLRVLLQGGAKHE
jgi:hypothetical protein